MELHDIYAIVDDDCTMWDYSVEEFDEVPVDAAVCIEHEHGDFSIGEDCARSFANVSRDHLHKMFHTEIPKVAFDNLRAPSAKGYHPS